jgi:Tol biopolymer transport system component
MTSTGGAYAYHPRFSPDSRQIVYAREEHLRYSIRVIDLESGQERTILPDSDPGIVVNRACWSPDGRWLAVLAHNSQVDGGDASALLDRANHRIVLVDPEGKNRREVTLKPQGSVETFPIDSIDWGPSRK